MTISRTTVTRETARQMRRSEVETGEHIHRMRLDAGVTLTEIARIVGVHRSHIARIESATARPSLEVLTAIGVALGADLSLRYFPGSGPRLHDRFQAAMVETLLRGLDPRWLVELEVPVTQPSRGVIDVVLTDRHSSTSVAIEVQSELRRLEQQLRWNAEKADGLARRLNGDGAAITERQISRLLVLRSTVTNREVARRYGATLAAAYPAKTEDVVRTLTGPLPPWPGPGIVWMQVEGAKASLMRFPPRGVDLGR